MMRFALLALVGVLSACTLGLGGKDKVADAARTSPITGGEVTVSALPGPPGAAAAGPVDAAKPSGAPPANPAKPGAAQPAAADPAKAAEKPVEEVAPPPPPLTPEQAACQKKGGKWAKVGRGGETCVQTTRDAGKQCRKASQCEGLCLARSGTCAPIKPLFGCNDVLQDNGAMVTLCID